MKKIYYLAAFLSLSFTSFAQRTLIQCGNLIDGIANVARSQVTIVVENNKIVSVDNGFTAPKGTDKVIDLKNKTVLPGLIDMHVHLENETSKDQFQKRMSQNMA